MAVTTSCRSLSAGYMILFAGGQQHLLPVQQGTPYRYSLSSDMPPIPLSASELRIDRVERFRIS